MEILTTAWFPAEVGQRLWKLKTPKYEVMRNQEFPMKVITIPIPEEIIEIYADIDKLKQVIIEDFVAGEYQKGNVSIRQGANILGLTYEQFMIDFLGKRRISFINGTAEELESELREEEAWLDDILENK